MVILTQKVDTMIKKNKEEKIKIQENLQKSVAKKKIKAVVTATRKISDDESDEDDEDDTFINEQK